MQSWHSLLNSISNFMVVSNPSYVPLQTALNKAMLWACKHDGLSATCLASVCGADVSIVNVPERFDFFASSRSSPPYNPNLHASLGGQISPCRCLCAIVGAWC